MRVVVMQRGQLILTVLVVAMKLILALLLALCVAIYAFDNSTVLEEAAGMSAGFVEGEYKPLTAELNVCAADYVVFGGCSTSSGHQGFCGSESSGCCSDGAIHSDQSLCPGSNDIKCCTQSSCSTPHGAGTCMSTSMCGSKRGQSHAGYCIGSEDVQCCITESNEVAVGTTQYGVDISTAVTSSSASCFKSSGYSFIVPRGYRSSGSVDTNVCTSLNNAKTAAISVRDVYLFPCPTCSKSASTQVNELVSYIKSNCASAWSGRIWLDIEGTQYWTGSYSTNKSWYQSLVSACNASGYKCGIYASSYQWSSIFGSTSYVYGNNLPLWYAHYDNSASFSDFTSFGGWTTPHAKQYVGTTTVCSMGVDKNYATAF